MLKVNPISASNEAPADPGFQHVCGSAMGGGTLLGLANLLTGVNDFDQIIQMAATGDSSTVDMLVKDIYGDVEMKELPGDVLACSFAKAAVTTQPTQT